MRRDHVFSSFLQRRPLTGPAPRGQELSSLAEADALRARFFSWRGTSGRRYVCTVFQRGEEAFVAAVESGTVIGVSHEGAAVRPLCVFAAGEGGRAGRALAALARELGVDEWHVHFCENGEAARDLSASLLS